MTELCVCGHTRTNHDYGYGCGKFLCCNRTKNRFPGKRGTEHDGVDHRAQSCVCEQFQKATRWDEDKEAGAIG